MTLRGNEPSQGYWGLPGGVVEVGEKLEEALVREILEETGIKVRPEKLITIFDSIKKDDQGRIQYHYILFEYLCSCLQGEIRASTDALDVNWVSLKQLDSIKMKPSTRKFIKKVYSSER